MPVYEMNGVTLIVNRTINDTAREIIKNGLFDHFMNKALDELENYENDGSEEPTKQT